MRRSASRSSWSPENAGTPHRAADLAYQSLSFIETIVRMRQFASYGAG
jgi:hypothetical protein